MMKQRAFAKLLPILALAATVIGHAIPAKADLFRYSLTGLEGGGILSGEFEASDDNNDGLIVANGIGGGTELHSLTVKLSGNAILPDFSLKDPNNFGGFIYKLGASPLGDDLVPSERYAEFLSFAQFNPDGIIDFASRFDVPGAGHFDDADGYLSVLIGDPATGAVLFDEYIAVTGLIDVNRVPLPGAIAFLSVGVLGLIALSARKAS